MVTILTARTALSKTQPLTLNQQLRSFISQWHSKYPFDYIWRTKYKVSFNSAQHRATDFISMTIELEEERMLNEYKKSLTSDEDPEIEELRDLNIVKSTKQEIDKDFNDFNFQTSE